MVSIRTMPINMVMRNILSLVAAAGRDCVLGLWREPDDRRSADENGCEQLEVPEDTSAKNAKKE